MRLVVAATRGNDPEIHAAGCADVARGLKSGRYQSATEIEVAEVADAAREFWADFLPGGCAYGEVEPAMTDEDAQGYTRYLPCAAGVPADAGTALGVDAADQAAYQLPCRSQGDPGDETPRPCGAQPGQPCVDYDRQGSPCVKPWAHPVRVEDGARALAAGEITGSAAVTRVAPDVFRLTVLPMAVTAAPAPGPAAHDGGGKVTECEACGYKFAKPQSRRTCKVPAACAKRRAARVAATA
jgi:hypothetical protein